MNKSNSRNKSHKGNRKAGSPVNVHIVQDVYTTIPKMIVQPVRRWNLRFVNSGAAINGRSFTSLELASMLGLIAATTTASTYLSSIFRLARVQIWCLPSAVGTPCTVQAFWANLPDSSFVGTSPPKPVTDTTLSVDRYAYVNLTPPSNSLVAGKWWNTTHPVSPLVLTIPADGVLELGFQFIVDDLGLATVGPTISTGVNGNIYHRVVAGLTVQGLNPI